MLIYLTDGLFENLLVIALVVFAVGIMNSIFSYLYNILFHKYSLKTISKIQVKVAEETMKLEVSELDSQSSGVFIDRVNNDTREIINIFSDLGDGIIDVIGNVGVLVAIFFINKVMFVYFVVVITIIYVLEHIRMKKFFELDKKRRELSEKNTGLVSELVRGVRDIKTLNIENNFLKKAKEKLVESNKESYKMQKVNVKYNFLTGTVQDLSKLLLIVLGVYLCLNNQLTTEEIFAQSGLELGKSIFSSFNIVTKVKLKQNGYIEDAKVSKKLPNIIQIEVKEREKMFQIETKTGYFIDIDEQGYIIDCSQERENLIVITGMEITEENIEQKKRLENEDLNIRMENILHIKKETEQIGIFEKITAIQIGEEYILKLDNDGITINLGDCTDLKNKIYYVQSILEKEAGNQREIIAFMHYPPVTQSLLSNNGESEFIDLMKKYNIKRCYYGHLHGQAHKDAIEGNVEGIELKLISADYLDFDLLKL